MNSVTPIPGMPTLAWLQDIIKRLESVLCMPNGEACINGTKEDNDVVAGVLADLRSMVDVSPVTTVSNVLLEPTVDPIDGNGDRHDGF